MHIIQKDTSELCHVAIIHKILEESNAIWNHCHNTSIEREQQDLSVIEDDKDYLYKD